ncbi:MAG: glycosyltransferase family 39 protein [Isosphaeraceae bacterium]|nr:glycosyltransferase family 39 protein [Isosphaeraceae bacterium]
MRGIDAVRARRSPDLTCTHTPLSARHSRTTGRRYFVDLAPSGRVHARSRWPTPAQATLFVLVLGLVWRTLRYLLAFPLWNDEAFLALSILTRDLAGLAQPLEFGQIAPPGFLWAEWGIVRLLGKSELALRLVPYLAGVCSLLLFRHFCRGVAGRRVVLVAVALLAASFYPVRHANEVKPYAIDLLVTLVLMGLGWRVWLEPRRGERWAVLIIMAAVGVWCSYPAVFPAASVAVLVGFRAWRERTPRVWAWGLTYILVLAASWALMAVTFALPQARASAWLPGLSTWRGAFPPLAHPWRLPWWLLEVHTGNMLAYPHGGHNFGSTPTFLLVMAGIWALWRQPRRRSLLWLLLGPLAFALVAAALRRYPYGTSARIMLYMAPAFCLLAAEGSIALLRTWGRRGLRYGPFVLAGSLALLTAAWVVTDISAPYTRRSDLEKRRLIQQWAEITSPGDLWVVFDGATPLPQVPEMMVSQWVQRVADFRYDVRSLAPVPVWWEPDPQTVALLHGRRIWFFVHHHGCARLYPGARLAAYEKALTARLGPPVSSGPLFVDGAILVVHVYSP